MKTVCINEKMNFLREIIGVYGSKISNVSSNSEVYVCWHGKEHKIDYDDKFINYKNNLELEEKRKDE